MPGQERDNQRRGDGVVGEGDAMGVCGERGMGAQLIFLLLENRKLSSASCVGFRSCGGN